LAAGGWVFLGLGAAGFVVYVAETPQLISVGQYAVGALFFLLIGWISLRGWPRQAQAAVEAPREAEREDPDRFRRAEVLKFAPFGAVGLVLLVVAPGILSWYAGVGLAVLSQRRRVAGYEREAGVALFRERGDWRRRRPLYVGAPTASIGE